MLVFSSCLFALSCSCVLVRVLACSRVLVFVLLFLFLLCVLLAFAFLTIRAWRHGLAARFYDTRDGTRLMSDTINEKNDMRNDDEWRWLACCLWCDGGVFVSLRAFASRVLCLLDLIVGDVVRSSFIVLID